MFVFTNEYLGSDATAAGCYCTTHKSDVAKSNLTCPWGDEYLKCTDCHAHIHISKYSSIIQLVMFVSKSIAWDYAVV